MDTWVVIAERFGIPVVMLGGVSYAMIKLFQWMANNLMKQIAENHTRIEGIIIKLIDNSKAERDSGRERSAEINTLFEKVLTTLDSTYSIMAKLYKNARNGNKEI